MNPEIISSIIGTVGTVFGALIVGIAGGLISRRYAKERDKQDKESQWRDHAIELTKLDLQRKINARDLDPEKGKLRPSILDFLANYRDLKELDEKSPKVLYQIITEKRIKDTAQTSGTEDTDT